MRSHDPHIAGLAEERHRHWCAMARGAGPGHNERAERVIAITRQLNGHAEDIGYGGQKGGGLYGEKRRARLTGRPEAVDRREGTLP